MEDIAHLLAPDLSRFLDQESQVGVISSQAYLSAIIFCFHLLYHTYSFQSLNQTFLSNKRACADLYSRLMTSDIEREKRLYIYWKERLENWKKLQCQTIVNNFKYVSNCVGKTGSVFCVVLSLASDFVVTCFSRAHMESSVVQDPAGPGKALEQWTKEQTELNTRRLELIVSLRCEEDSVHSCQ